MVINSGSYVASNDYKPKVLQGLNLTTFVSVPNRHLPRQAYMARHFISSTDKKHKNVTHVGLPAPIMLDLKKMTLKFPTTNCPKVLSRGLMFRISFSRFIMEVVTQKIET